MAIAGSGLLIPNIITAFTTGLALAEATAASLKIALFSNTLTPNYLADTAYAVAPYNANEVVGTNWSAGGVALGGVTSLVASVGGILTFDDTVDISVANCTFTGARGGLIYNNALAPKAGIVFVDFVTDQSPSAGTFQIVWAAGGIYALDLVP